VLHCCLERTQRRWSTSPHLAATLSYFLGAARLKAGPRQRALQCPVHRQHPRGRLAQIRGFVRGGLFRGPRPPSSPSSSPLLPSPHPPLPPPQTLPGPSFPSPPLLAFAQVRPCAPPGLPAGPPVRRGEQSMSSACFLTPFYHPPLPHAPLPDAPSCTLPSAALPLCAPPPAAAPPYPPRVYHRPLRPSWLPQGLASRRTVPCAWG